MTKQQHTQPLVPELRFPEFNEEWVKVKLGNLVSIKSGHSPSSYNYSEDGKNPFIKVEELNNCEKYQVLSRFYSNSTKGIVEKNAILFPKRGAAILNNKVRISATPLLMDSNMMALECHSNDLYFEFLFYKIIKEKLYKIADTSTIPQLNNKHILPYKFNLPSLPEQQKIASFLTQVDNKIAQLTKKKELLEQYKKGVMQKIFSQEIRFKISNKDGELVEPPKWEKKKLGEVFEERSEKGFEDMELLSVSIQNGIYPQNEGSKTDNSSKNKSNYKRVLKNDIAYNSMRMWQGASAVSKYDGIVSPAYTVLKGNNRNDSHFFGELFKMTFMIQTFQKHSQGLTSDTWNLKYKGLSKINVFVACHEEQTKIANFLQSIDKKIEQVNMQLTQAQTWKKGLLQKMFV